MTQEHLEVSAFLAAKDLGSKVDAVYGMAQDITFTKIAIVLHHAVVVVSVCPDGRLAIRADPLSKEQRPTRGGIPVFISPNGSWILAEQTLDSVRVVWEEQGEVHHSLDHFGQGPITGIVQNWSQWFLQTSTGLWNFNGQRKNNSVCPVMDRAYWSVQDPLPPEVSKDWVWQTQSSVLPSGNFYLWAKDKDNVLHVYSVRARENLGPASKIHSWTLDAGEEVISIHPTFPSAISKDPRGDHQIWWLAPQAETAKIGVRSAKTLSPFPWAWSAKTALPSLLPWAWRRLGRMPRLPVSPRQGHQQVFLDHQGRYLEVCLHEGILTIHHEGENEC